MTGFFIVRLRDCINYGMVGSQIIESFFILKAVTARTLAATEFEVLAPNNIALDFQRALSAGGASAIS